MTRKKYDRDLEGEAIHAVYGKDDSETDEEEEEVEHDPWDEVQSYITNEIKHSNADWMYKWFDATKIINIIEAEYDVENAVLFIKDYLFPFETHEDVNCLLDHMWNMHDICRIEVNMTKLYNATLELLAERTKYYYVNPTVAHRRLVNRKFFQMERHSSVAYTSSQQQK
jgi:hypothetical protein